MLKKRQIEILLDLFENTGSYMTASEFTRKFDVSLRTIQNDMREIRLSLSDLASPCVKIESEAPKGTRIVVTDPDGFEKLKVSLYQEYMDTTANSLKNHDRIKLLLLTLLDKYRPTSYYELESTLFVSHSTLINDLKVADGILQKYHLDLMRNAKKIMIDGYEIGKRLCISKENLFPSLSLLHAAENEFWKQQDRIRSIIVKTFVYFKKEISEVALTNATLFLNVAIYRMKKGFFITPEELVVSGDIDKEYELSKETFRRIEDSFVLNVPDSEIAYFASLIEKNIEKKMTGEEIAFLAIHLYSSIAEKQRRAGQLKVLVISSLRRSENLLLRQTLIDCQPVSDAAGLFEPETGDGWLSEHAGYFRYLSPRLIFSLSRSQKQGTDFACNVPAGRKVF